MTDGRSKDNQPKTLSIDGRTLVGQGIEPLFSDARQSLQWLLDPLPIDDFLADIWRVRHHHVQRRDPNYYAKLFDSAAIEQYIEFARPEPLDIRLVSGGRDKPAGTFCSADGRVDFVRLRQAFADGHTIILNSLERYVATFATLAKQIEAELNYDALANAYISPPNAQGFLPHFDDHDALVLQLEGAKTWQIYEALGDVPARELPLRKRSVEGQLPEPVRVELSAGDLLYVPRGRVHAATTSNHSSFHVTLGIHPPNVMSLITKIFECLGYRNDAIFHSLPPRHLSDPDARSALRSLIEEAIALVDDQAIGEGIGALEDKLVRRGRCQPVGQFIPDGRDEPSIDLNLMVERSPFTLSRVLAVGDGVALHFAQSLVSAGREFEEAILFIARSSGPFTIGSLPGLSDDQRLDLARELILDGFLVRADEYRAEGGRQFNRSAP
jgi:ribosomal protein L16 Arg81 hydroxylase